MGVNMKMLVVQVAGLFLVMGLTLFIPAGTFAWPAAWAFLILFFAFTVVLTAWLLRNDPGLLTERMTGFQNPDQKDWDKVGVKIMHVLFFGWFVIMGLDAVRFSWSHMPPWLQIVGVVMQVCSFYLSTLR